MLKNEWEPWETVPKDCMVLALSRWGEEDWKFDIELVTYDPDENKWLNYKTFRKIKSKPQYWMLPEVVPWGIKVDE